MLRGLSEQDGVNPYSCMTPMFMQIDPSNQIDVHLVNQVLQAWFKPTWWDRHHYPITYDLQAQFKENIHDDQQFMESQRQLEDTLEALLKGNLDHWKKDHHASLVYLILCSQVSKILFKGTSKAYMFDPYSCKLSRAIL